MDVCASVERDVDKILNKFEDTRKSTDDKLTQLLAYIQNIQSEISQDTNGDDLGAAHRLYVSQGVQKVKDTLTGISSEHKDLHSSVSKVGKSIDRNFVSDFTSVLTDGAFTTEDKLCLINQVIGEHFLRQGMLDIAENLILDSGLEIEPDQKEPFLELHRILEALKVKNLQPALEWTQANREKLQAQQSTLEFKLHRLRFIDLVSQGPSHQMAALLYARNFEPFAICHAQDLQVLMGMLLYMRQGLVHSPYAYVLDPIHWVDICEVFTRDACALLGLSVESPLSVTIRAGCTALPPLLTIKQVMQQRQCTGVWSAKDELPVEIDLGEESRFHSIFACPILRQQSTENNPPVRLVCGHVISKDALTKLTNGNKVKCPYCPMEQTPGDAHQIYI